MTPEQCLEVLELCDWNVHYAIKLVRVRLAAAGDVTLAAGGDVTLAAASRALDAAAGDVVKASAALVSGAVRVASESEDL